MGLWFDSNFLSFALKIGVTFDYFNLHVRGQIPVFNIWLISSVKVLLTDFLQFWDACLTVCQFHCFLYFWDGQLMKQHNLYLCLSNLKLISSIPKINSAFCMKSSYFMNKWEPPRWQRCQWSSFAHNRLQSFSISLFWPKSYWRADLVYKS